MSRRGTEPDDFPRLGVLSFHDLNVQLPSTFSMTFVDLKENSNNICKLSNARTR